jgi:hypothetical protein
MFDIDVTRINKKYVHEDCAQVMFAFKKEMVIDNPHTKELFFVLSDNVYKNQYLDDKRRTTFPYGNIAVHNERKGFTIFKVANQILGFDTVYRVRYPRKYSRRIREDFCKVLKDGDEALLVTSSNVRDLNINVETIKNLETLGKIRIVRHREPRFALSINRNIKREDIRKGKQLAKKRTTK